MVANVNLTPKQQAFCDYYLETGNATEAYRRAAYSGEGNVAEAAASRLLSSVKVRFYIDERLKEKESTRIASQDEVLQYLTSVMRGEEIEEVPIVMQGAFEIVEKKPSINDRTKAAELLGKRYGTWKENVNIASDVFVRFVDDVDD